MSEAMTTGVTAADRAILPVVDDGVWDLFVVGGGGTVGLRGCPHRRVVRSLGADVGARPPGRECLWTGCAPSKALLAAASAATIEPTDSLETLRGAGGGGCPGPRRS